MNFVRVGTTWVNMDHVGCVVQEMNQVTVFFSFSTDDWYEPLSVRGEEAKDLLAYLEGEGTDISGYAAHAEQVAARAKEPTHRALQQAGLLPGPLAQRINAASLTEVDAAEFGRRVAQSLADGNPYESEVEGGL